MEAEKDFVSKLLAIGEGGCHFFVSCLLHLSPEQLKACRLVSTNWDRIIKDGDAWAGRDDWQPDQRLLKRYVWPWARGYAISHDSYHCNDYWGPKKEAYPTRREKEPNNAVGAVVADNKTLWQTCPVYCRPKEHLDWAHC